MKYKSVIASLLVGVLAVGMLGNAYADRVQFKTPTGSRGKSLASSDYGGYKFHTITGAGEEKVCSGACLLAGVWMSSGLYTNGLRLRDTAYIGTAASANLMLPVISFQSASGSYRNVLSVPLRADNGITVEMESAGNSASATVFYVELN